MPGITTMVSNAYEDTYQYDYYDSDFQQLLEYFTTHFNFTDNDYILSADDLAIPATEQLFLMCGFILSMALSVVGNLIVIIVLACGTRSWTDLNIFLVNLSLADLTMAIFCMPFTFPTIMKGHWIFGKAMCPIVVSLQQISVCVSIYTLTAIGIDRYYAVLYPFKLRVTKNRAKYIVFLIWIVSILLSVVVLVTARSRPVDLNDFIDTPEDIVFFCSERVSPAAAMGYEFFILVITYIIPLCILSYTYYNIGRRLWGRSLPGNADYNRDLSQMRSKRKTIKMLVIIVVVFSSCWFPLQVFNVINDLVPSLYADIETQDSMRIAQSCALLLAMANSFMNPIIYGFLNEGFRNDAKKILKCNVSRHPRRHRSSATSTVTHSTRDSSLGKGPFKREMQRLSTSMP
ncbi:QRFP-like peptide receptor [Saccoglossus kowalevskii]|uniref:Orexin receptor type 2-like n=1 Tax=Saccoglossus kowalevskii TaxID=10224 RepID=A0ABM0GIE6_SACKO|nr:PREDICTED: orexin receptor type 2-like [Saccoglossus kowalevskii]